MYCGYDIHQQIEYLKNGIELTLLEWHQKLKSTLKNRYIKKM